MIKIGEHDTCLNLYTSLQKIGCTIPLCLVLFSISYNCNAQNGEKTNCINNLKLANTFYNEGKINQSIQLITPCLKTYETKEYFEALKEQKEEQRAAIEENKKLAAEQELQEDTIYKTTIVKVLEEKLKTKDFDGIPLNPDKARKVIDFLTTKKYQTKDKQKLTEYPCTDVFRFSAF